MFDQLVLTAALYITPTVVGIHDDMPGRAVATCELITEAVGPNTECVLLPPLGRNKVDVVLYTDFQPSRAVADVDAYLRWLGIETPDIRSAPAIQAPVEGRWGGNAGSTQQPYDGPDEDDPGFDQYVADHTRGTR